MRHVEAKLTRSDLEELRQRGLANEGPPGLRGKAAPVALMATQSLGNAAQTLTASAHSSTQPYFFYQLYRDIVYRRQFGLLVLF